MRYFICLLLMLFISQQCVKAQMNLVPNPSFEDTLSCPTYYNQLYKANGWSSYRNSPDFFNSCNDNVMGVPNNDLGYQLARTGQAYAGFIAFAVFGINYREVFGTELISPLNINQKYFVSFYVNLAIGEIQHSKVASNKIGMRFTTYSYTPSNPIPIDNYSQIYSDSIITDSLGCVRIDGNFIADSAYKYLSIGCFFNDSLTSRVTYDSLAAYSYYFIDDVSVSIDSTVNVMETINSTSTLIYSTLTQNLINVSGEYISTLLIYDLTGKICRKKENILSNNVSIDIRDLNKGCYIIMILSQNKLFYKKIIVF